MILLLSALIVLLILGTMVLFGYLWKKHPPKTINGIYGYRTRRSMQNWATWEFAHQYCARLWRKLGCITAAASVLVLLPFLSLAEDTLMLAAAILTFLQMFPLLLSIIPVEAALKRNFDEYGVPRQNPSV